MDPSILIGRKEKEEKTNLIRKKERKKERKNTNNFQTYLLDS